jgi:hypothetical protein
VTHCWVEDEKKNIVDVTATQFRTRDYTIRSVEIVNEKHPLRKYYSHKRYVPSLNSSIIQSWPVEQRANESLVDILVNDSIKRIKQHA